MSLLSEVIKYGKDIVLLGERVDALMVHRKEATCQNGETLGLQRLPGARRVEGSGASG